MGKMNKNTAKRVRKITKDRKGYKLLLQRKILPVVPGEEPIEQMYNTVAQERKGTKTATSRVLYGFR
jgi:hypothetical protein